VPWFHENALLQVDGRDDDLADVGPVALLADLRSSPWNCRDLIRSV
jgi:hypothetical protein